MTTLQDIIKDMEAGIYDFTVDGHCSNCGSCCSNFLPVSDVEIKRIRKYIKRHGVKEQIRVLPTANPTWDMTCPFRSDKEKKCLIYEVRPGICRDFQCDKPKKQIYANRDLYHGKYAVYDMRKEFFRKER